MSAHDKRREEIARECLVALIRQGGQINGKWPSDEDRASLAVATADALILKLETTHTRGHER